MNEIWNREVPAEDAGRYRRAEPDRRKAAILRSVREPATPHVRRPAGTGQTTSALALAGSCSRIAWRDNFVELNASDERRHRRRPGQDQGLRRTAPIGGSSFKIIFLDEADALTSDAQAGFEKDHGEYSANCRFILSCNYSSKIIRTDPVPLRRVQVQPLRAEDVKEYLRRIAKEEKVPITEDALDAVVHVGEGDMRKSINALQVAAAIGNEVTLEVVYQTTGNARPDEVLAMIETALAGDFVGARNKLDEILLTYGLSGEDIIKQIHRSFFDLSIPDYDRSC